MTYELIEETDSYEIGRRDGLLIAACLCGSGLSVIEAQESGRTAVAEWRTRHAACAKPSNDAGARWTDRWVALWYRLTYCTRYGHKHSAFGGDVDGYCLNCGKPRDTPRASRAQGGVA